MDGEYSAAFPRPARKPREHVAFLLERPKKNKKADFSCTRSPGGTTSHARGARSVLCSHEFVPLAGVTIRHRQQWTLIKNFIRDS